MSDESKSVELAYQDEYQKNHEEAHKGDDQGHTDESLRAKSPLDQEKLDFMAKAAQKPEDRSR